MNATSTFKFESRNVSAMFIGLALSAVLPATVSNAVTITDTTTATTLFSDNYTQWTAGQAPSTVNAPDYSTQPFPIPQVGTYLGGAAASEPLSSAPIQVITSATSPDPGAPAGNPSTYFRFYRDNNGPAGVGSGQNANTNLVASLSTSVNSGDTVEFQTMINLNGTGAADAPYTLNMDLYSNSNGSGSFIGISSDGTGHMQIYNGSAWVDTNVAYTSGTWEKLTVDYQVGSSSLSITMGSSSESGIAVPGMGSVGSVAIDNGNGGAGGSFYLASVPVSTPEPSALVLAAIGGLGAVGLRFWRRRSG